MSLFAQRPSRWSEMETVGDSQSVSAAKVPVHQLFMSNLIPVEFSVLDAASWNNGRAQFLQAAAPTNTFDEPVSMSSCRGCGGVPTAIVAM